MLEAKNISKKFGSSLVLNKIDLQVREGKVLALIGENGAGKSTLMKILSGVYIDYDGEIIIDGSVKKFTNAKDAQLSGIAIIHQELNLVQQLSILENIYLGVEIKNKFGLLDYPKMESMVQQLLSKLKFKKSPHTIVSALSIGEQQIIEIAKALHSNAKYIIMDEPTSALSASEIDVLFALIKELKAEGRGLVYISHKLDELYSVADEYTILRDGVVVDRGAMVDIKPEQIVSKMVGRDIAKSDVSFASIDSRVTALQVLSLHHQHHLTKQKSISFNLYKGEILGVFGLMGAGRTELLMSLFGMGSLPCKISIDDHISHIDSPQKAIEHGMAFVSEDRKLEGIIPEFTINQSMSLASLNNFLKFGFIQSREEHILANEYVKKLNVKTPSINALIKNLSGGNQQKVILAKWLATNPKILLLDEPTRGIDVNAKAEIYDIIRQLNRDGMSVIMVSSELPEIFALSHRVLVMREGQISKEFSIADATEENIMEYALAKTDASYLGV